MAQSIAILKPLREKFFGYFFFIILIYSWVPFSSLLTLPRLLGFARLVKIFVSINFSIFFSILSESFKPSGPKSFKPLSEYRLCDAVIIIPKFALIFFVSIANALVGRGPNVKTCIPADANPDTNAGSKL